MSVRDVFIFAGQSNMSGYSPAIVLQGSGYNPAFDPSFSQSSAPDYVPAYAKTAANEWTGSPPASADAPHRVYPYPDDEDGTSCPIAAAVNVTDVPAEWSALSEIQGYGPELSFLQRHLADRPAVPIAAVKVSMGGSSLAGDWLPAATGSNAGADKYLWPVLRDTTANVAAWLDASDGPGNWRWAALVWEQGESGAHSGATDDATYLSDARAFFAAVRALAARPDLPVIVNRIGNNWGWQASGSGETAAANPYLVAAGVPYAAVDYSITSGALSVTQGRRDAYVASGQLRRLTQVTLGGDPNCRWVDTDDVPVRPPLSLTAADNDATGYHRGGPGNLAVGERAYAAYAGLVPLTVRAARRGALRRLRTVA